MLAGPHPCVERLATSPAIGLLLLMLLLLLHQCSVWDDVQETRHVRLTTTRYVYDSTITRCIPYKNATELIMRFTSLLSLCLIHTNLSNICDGPTVVGHSVLWGLSVTAADNLWFRTAYGWICKVIAMNSYTTCIVNVAMGHSFSGSWLLAYTELVHCYVLSGVPVQRPAVANRRFICRCGWLSASG